MTQKQEDVLFWANRLELPVGEISDGYHTFNELYDHRTELWITLCRMLMWDDRGIHVWRSKKHSDGSEFEGWFILGVSSLNEGPLCPGVGQLTYHIPISRWTDCDWEDNYGRFETLERAPKFDGHTSADVLRRLREL